MGAVEVGDRNRVEILKGFACHANYIRLKSQGLVFLKMMD